MPGIIDPTKAFTTKAHPFSLHADGVDLIDGVGGRGFGVSLDTISIAEVGGNGSSTMNFIITDTKLALAIQPLARVQFNRHSSNEVLFAGYMTQRQVIPYPGPTGVAVHVTCVDYNMLLDLTILPALTTAVGVSDQHLIGSVLAHSIRHKTIYAHSTLILSTNASMPAFDFTHMTLRAAIEAIGSNAGPDRHYYVDFLGRLHYYSGATETAMGAAPFVITDAPSGAQRAAETLSLDYDDSEMINAIFIQGGTRAGTGWVTDEVSIKTYGLREAMIDSVHSTTAARLANVGAHFLALHKDPIVRGSFTTTGTDANWRVGQTVTITNAACGLSAAPYPIKQIDTVFLAGDGRCTRTIHFGELPASGRRRGRDGGRGPLPPVAPPKAAAPRPVAAHHVGAAAHPRNKKKN